MLATAALLVTAVVTSAPGDAAIKPVAAAAMPGADGAAGTVPETRAVTRALTKAQAAATSPEQIGYAIKSVMTIDGPLGHGNYYWDESRAPATGPMLITVDLEATNDGVAIHGSDVEWGYGTRGCIGVPTAFAKKLFDQIKLGDVVIVTNGQRINVGDAVSGV